MNKRGISEVVSWVLLIGFAVSLAVIVTVWTLNTAEKTTRETVKMVSSDMRCADVFINLEVDCDTKMLNTILNSGRFTVNKVLIRADDNKAEMQIDLKPNEKGENLNKAFISSIEVIPLIKIDKEWIGCSDKAKEVKC